MSSSSPGGPYVLAFSARVGSGNDRGDEFGRDRRVDALPAQERDDPPGAVGVVEREALP